MNQIQKIACLGAGYVGGPTMAVLAKYLPSVEITLLDIDEERIRMWNSDRLPIYEPGLDEIVFERRDRNLFFQNLNPQAIKEADMVFICVPTPTKEYGFFRGMGTDMSYLELAGRYVLEHSPPEKKQIIVEKSTVPIKTAEILDHILNHQEHRFEILSNPEFLAEGEAIENLLHPDRVLIGHSQTPLGREAGQRLKDLYSQWVPEEKIILIDTWSSELSKLAANAFLAQRISSINAISPICEKAGAKIQNIAKAVGMDSRIGPKFLKAGIGFGGSCFEKDLLSLIYIAKSLGLPEVADYWHAVLRINQYQVDRFVEIVIEKMFKNVKNKKIAVLGTSFKANTDDVRNSQALKVVRKLHREKALLYLYDPKAIENTRYFLKDLSNIHYCHHPDEAIEKSHAILVLTDWQEFATYDYQRYYQMMEKPAFFFDGRGVVDLDKLKAIGFQCFGIGQG